MQRSLTPIRPSYELPYFLQFHKATYLQLWWVWFYTITIVTAILVVTLNYAPFLFMDELMNVDLGRTILNPDTDWSIAWLTPANKAVFLISYVGPVLQEFVYQLAGEIGPRISGVVGALAASTIMLGYLRSRGTTKLAAYILSLALLLDPLFVQAYTTGRVDGWAMALCLSSCWLIRNATLQLTNDKFLYKNLAGSGALAIFALFVWPSAGFLLPLILIELVHLVSTKADLSKGWLKASFPIAIFMAGGLITGILLLIPILPQLVTMFGSMVDALKVNTNHGGDTSNVEASLSMSAAFIELLRVLKFTPLLFLLAIVAWVWKRPVAVTLSVLVLACLMMSTVVYISRVQYLLPYFILSAAALYSKRSSHEVKFSKIKSIGLFSILIWSVGLTLFARTFVALYQKDERDRDLVNQAAVSMVGSGNYSVALFSSFEFYYAGRALGWKMYSPYIPAFAKISNEHMREVLHLVDYAIIPEDMFTEDYGHILKSEGMREKGVFNSYKEPFNKEYITDYSKTTNLDRIHIVYRIPRQPYGPYKIFVREEIPAKGNL